MKWIHKYCFSLILLSVSFSSFSINHLKEAELLVKEKQYEDAVSHYKEYLKSDSINSSVYYNLGSCYFFQKKYGNAIWAFEKALKYNPRDEEAIFNIEICYQKLKKVEPWKPSIGLLERVLYGLGSNFWAYGSIALSILLSLCIYLFYTSKNSGWKKVQMLIALFLIIALIGSIFLTYSTKMYYSSSNFGIVVTESTPIYQGTDTSNLLDYSLLEGDRIEIISETKDRFIIELNNNEVCSIQKQGIKKI